MCTRSDSHNELTVVWLLGCRVQLAQMVWTSFDDAGISAEVRVTVYRGAQHIETRRLCPLANARVAMLCTRSS